MLALALTIFILSWVVPVSAQTDDQYLIGDGRIGVWKVGAAEADLLKDYSSRFGPGFTVDAPFPHKLSRSGKAYFWRRAGFQFISYEGRVVSITIWKRYTDPTPNAELMKYRTKEGIGIGEPLSKATAAYQLPPRQWQVHWFGGVINTAMVWPALGLYLEIRDRNVDAIGVYDPGAPWDYQ